MKLGGMTNFQDATYCGVTAQCGCLNGAIVGVVSTSQDCNSENRNCKGCIDCLSRKKKKKGILVILKYGRNFM